MFKRITARLQQERGFSLIETLVSMSILSGGVFGLVNTVDAERKLTTVSETQSVAARIAERDMERVMSAPFKHITLKSCSGACTYSWNGTDSEPLVVNNADPDAIDPASTGQPAGRFTVDIYRHVTWASDPGLANTAVNDPNGHDYKRVTITVRVLQDGAYKNAVTTSSIAIDPCAGPGRAAVCLP